MINEMICLMIETVNLGETGPSSQDTRSKGSFTKKYNFTFQFKKLGSKRLKMSVLLIFYCILAPRD